MSEWGKFVRDNFDKLLLTALFCFSCWLVVHMSHDGRDADIILWGRELSGTIVGALLGLITGHALANARSTVTTTGSGTGGPTTLTSTTEGK